MKKVFLCAALIVCVVTIGFSQEEAQSSQLKPSSFQVDMWFTTGAAFGNYLFGGTHAENDYIGSPGINLSFYSLFGPNQIGIFFNYGILFPAIYGSGQSHDQSAQLDFILFGFGFGHDINESIKLHLGIGPHLSFFGLINSVDKETTINNYILGLGIGGDIGIKLNVTKFVCIDFGTTLAYNFAVLNEISREKKGKDSWRNRKIETSNWNDINSIIGIKPYITVGFNLNTAALGSK